MNNLNDMQIRQSVPVSEQLPDLYLYTGAGWEDGIIVSNAKGGSSLYTLTTDDTLYISFAVVNYGVAAAGSFAGMLFIDNVAAYSLECNNGLNCRQGTVARDVYLGSLTAGRHILTVKSDYFSSVAESNEKNNEYSVIITVSQGETTPADYLLITRWDQRGNGQSAYAYNKYVPDGKMTGCTNVAVAQILYYWVDQGYGLQLQVSNDDCMYRLTNGHRETIGAANMQERCGITLEDLNGIIETVTCEAPNWDGDDDIAGLSLASMLILNSEIGDNGTATRGFAEAALFDRADFHYDCISCPGAGSVPWDRVQANIDDGSPVLAGVSSIMHTLVIDGYNADTEEYHLNFGWGFEGYKNDKKYNFETGTGWYLPEELNTLDITYLVLDIHPNYDIDDPTKKAMMTVDWSDRITPEMATGNGFYVTVATPSEMLSLTVSQNGVNVFMDTRNARLSTECLDGTPVLQNQKLQAAFGRDDEPLLLQGKDNALTDLFFARTSGVWDSQYVASHVGDAAGWNGTGEVASLQGKNKVCDIFEGTGNSAILRLTDDACGDALFADDIFTASYDHLGEKQARLSNLHEIIAGAGDDIVDLTSSRFDVQASAMVIHGNEGNDILWGGANRNALFGDAGNDRLVGGPDNDVIVGGIGNDSMSGEGGDDIFCFCGNWGKDVVNQAGDGRVTLWFNDGSLDGWDASSLTYTSGDNSVCVSGVSSDKIALTFGNDGSELYRSLKTSGAFSSGMLA